MLVNFYFLIITYLIGECFFLELGPQCVLNGTLCGFQCCQGETNGDTAVTDTFAFELQLANMTEVTVFFQSLFTENLCGKMQINLLQKLRICCPPNASIQLT